MLKREINEFVLINPYAKVTGVIVGRRDLDIDNYGSFDYKVKLHLPVVDKSTIFSANYDEKNKYWWNYFNDDELDILERNYKMVTR